MGYVDEFLDLSWRKHPANIENNLNIGDGCFLQLEKFSSLLKMFQLKSSLWHVVTFAPLFDSSNIIVDL